MRTNTRNSAFPRALQLPQIIDLSVLLVSCVECLKVLLRQLLWTIVILKIYSQIHNTGFYREEGVYYSY